MDQNQPTQTPQPNLGGTAPNQLAPVAIPTTSTPEAPTPTPSQPRPPSPVQKMKTKLGGTNIWVKIVITIAGIAVFLLALMGILTITSIDTQIFKITLSGQILDDKGKAAEGVTVKVGDTTTVTDANGNYEISGLIPGDFELEISGSGYEDYSRTISLNRSFLDYSSNLNFSVQVAGIGQVSGRFITEDEEYTFVKDTLLIDEKPQELQADGSFSVSNLQTGSHIIELRSVSYRDQKLTFSLVSGNNPPLEDIKLEPAGDITGELLSHVRNDLIEDLEIEVEGVPPSNKEIRENFFFISDLEIGRTYDVRISKPGYNSRDYKVTVEQGLNQIPEFNVVESGFIPFLKKADRELEVFVSNYDGKQEMQLTTIENLDPMGEYIEGDIVYFLSPRDGVRNQLGGKALLAYAVSTQGGNMQRITNNTDNLGSIVPNFQAKKLANLTSGTERTHRALYIMDLTGADRKEIAYAKSGVFSSIKISDNGAYVLYYFQDQDSSLTGIYRGNTISGETTKVVAKENALIYDISHDGDRILYASPNSETELTELYLYTVSTGQDKRVLQNIAGHSQFQFVGISKTKVIYQSYRNQANNVFELDLDTNVETKLTNFAGSEGVEAVYQQAKFILYQTNRGLYIMDPDKPVHGVMVTSEVARYTGYDF